MKKVFLGGVLLSASMLVNAWDGTVTGTIKQVQVVPGDGDNRGLRVVMSGSPKM